MEDVIIVGGGPAGLNAGVVLGRCRRKVLLFDTGEYRNRYSHGMHNYLTRDDILPSDFIDISSKELEKYDVRKLPKRVISARKTETGLFLVTDEDDNIYHSRKLLIATGLQDNIPEVEGFREFYGRSVFHCPYCDAWEVSDKKIGVYAKNKDGWELALSLKAWSDDITLYTDGGRSVKRKNKEKLDATGISVNKNRIKKLEGENGNLKKIIFTNGEERDCDAIFFVNGYTQQCDLAEVFNCEIGKKGVVLTNRFQQTSVPGLYVAGDADKDMHFVVVAAAEGAKAGVTINKELQRDALKKAIKGNKHLA
jgi:thioredoxin reductase